MHILLIEDDLEAARLLLEGLHESGYTIDNAADGRDGLARAIQGQFDLSATGRMLPHRDGLTIIEWLRQAIDRGSDQPLIHTVRGSGYVLRSDG